MANPNHGYNQHGTCGSVAAQLLLGYNNYYNDRRLIDVEDLYGDWTGLVSNDLYDSSNYLNPNQNMNVCNNPMSLTGYTTGTNDDFYNYVIQNIEPSAFNCICTETNISISGSIATVTTTIYYPDGTNSVTVTTRPADPGETNSTNTVHTHNGSTVDNIVDGLESILSAKFSSNQYNITSDEKGWFFGWSPISSTPIKNEIDAGRPLIIGMNSNLGGRNHFVIGYGYQDYIYFGDTETYSGYIVNYGWPNKYNIWINESWCDSYIALSMSHIHDYSIVTSNIIGDTSIEVRCSTCGHRKLNDIFTISGNSIIGINYQLIGNIFIPSVIDGVTITSISNNVFRNSVGLVGITLPNTLTSIGESSFENCYNLSSIELPNFLISIGNNAFKNCSSLEEITLPSLLETIGNSAFKGCTSLEEIDIPSSVNSIGNESFYGCTSLSSVIVNKNKAPLLTLGLSAFYNHPTDFEITVPKNRLADYKNMSGWSSYRSSIEPNETIYPTNLYYNNPLPLSHYISSGLNRLYKIDVYSQGAYVITITNGTNAIVKIYNSSFVLKDTVTTSKSIIFNGSTIYYVSLEHTDLTTSGTISATIAKDLNHNHIYDHSYTWLNYNQHKAYCACGVFNNELHVVSAKSLGDGLQYVTCILCGGPANAGIVPGMKGIQVTENGSFISPNGTLVLLTEDIDSYFSGEIVSEHEDVEITRNINIPPYIVRKDEYNEDLV